MIRQNDPGYRSDLDIIDASHQPMPAELSTDDEDKAAVIGMKHPMKRDARGKAPEAHQTGRRFNIYPNKIYLERPTERQAPTFCSNLCFVSCAAVTLSIKFLATDIAP